MKRDEIMPPILDDVPINFPKRSLQAISRIGALVILKEETCYDYRELPPSNLFDFSLQRLQKYSDEDFARAKEAGDEWLMLELSLR